ncbi:hypothetical protein [Micropruina sp.]|uniref:hypothetical protein n=1 Tax=Micropruina sp. TaxID=2737536 RepID=UPI0039E5864A
MSSTKPVGRLSAGGDSPTLNAAVRGFGESWIGGHDWIAAARKAVPGLGGLAG